MKAKNMLPLLLLILLSSCKKHVITPIVLVNNSLLYKTSSLSAALTEDKLYRGEKVQIIKELKNTYLIYSGRLNLKGYIQKAHILNEKYTLGRVISEGKLFYADKNVLIPTETYPKLYSKVIIIEKKDKWYKINYQGSNFFFIEKKHISKNTSDKSVIVNIEGAGNVIVSAPFSNTDLIGYEPDFDINKMFDNNMETYFLSRPFRGNEVITLEFKDRVTFELKMINGHARSLNAYKSKARVYKIRTCTEEGIKREIRLNDHVLEPQSLGLFDTKILKLNIKDIYKSEKTSCFAISEIIIRPVGDNEYAKYEQLLAGRKKLSSILISADNNIKKGRYIKALENLDKALDEVPNKLRTSDIGISIRLAVLRIYLEKLRDYKKASKITEDLLELCTGEKNKKLIDLTKKPGAKSLRIDTTGLNTYFIEIKYRKKLKYPFTIIHLKSHINYLGALAYFKAQDVSKSLSLFKEIILKYKKHSSIRGSKAKNSYLKRSLDFIYKNIPADVAFAYLKDNILQDYQGLTDTNEDYNYFYYILGRLSEKNANKEYAVSMYKKCLDIDAAYRDDKKPLSYLLASKRIRELSGD